MYDIEKRDPEPAEVKASTEQYRKEQDLLSEFFDSCFERTNDKKEGVKKKEIAQKFKEWHKEAHDGENAPKGKSINEYFEKVLKLKYSQTYGYIGAKLKVDEASSNEGSLNEDQMEETDD